MNHLEAILLDMDGTMAMNAEDIHKNCVAKTLLDLSNDLNIPFDNEKFESVWFAGLGKGIAKFYKSFLEAEPLLANAPGVLPVEVFEATYMNNYFTTDEKIIMRDGVDNLIKFAKENGIKVAAVSNATQAVLEHTLLNLLQGTEHSVDDFNLVVGQDTILATGQYGIKPDGGSYLYACHKMGVNPANCLGAEDTFGGELSLHLAGIGHIVRCENTHTDKYEAGIDAWMENPANEFFIAANGLSRATLPKPNTTVRKGEGFAGLINLLSSTAATAVEHHVEQNIGFSQGYASSDKKIRHAPNFN